MAQEGTAEALPPPWTLRISRSKAKVYYFNTVTKETRWTRPRADADADADVLGASRKKQRTEHSAATATQDARRHADRQVIASDTMAGVEVVSAVRSFALRSMRVGATSFRALRDGGGNLFSPWSHQLDAIDVLARSIRDHEGETVDKYLVQHATGSGKTITIAALVHQLLYLVDNSGARFHTVVLLIDRVKLDEQVGDSVERYLRQNGIEEVFRATSIDSLAGILGGGDAGELEAQGPKQRVIITTIQKLGLLAKDPVLLARLLAGKSSSSAHEHFKRAAILVDEAHRSHNASTREAIEAVIKAGEDELGSATFIGFTATPNNEALQLFGTRYRNNTIGPTHCYSMRQAIADQRVMNVLEDYVCMRCHLETSVPNDIADDLRCKRQMRRLLDAASDDLAVLKAKSLYMMNDFDLAKHTHQKLKCMIVTRSRRDVVRYHGIISTFIGNKKLPWRVFAAFSGSIDRTEVCDGHNPSRLESVTEQTINTKDGSLALSDIVIVCDKLDTGYSEPLLGRMYIDRYLQSSSQTVQLLSRLNRRHTNKPSVRIIDFANHPARIVRHFADFWTERVWMEAVDTATACREFVTSAWAICDILALWTSCDQKNDLPARVDEAAYSMDRDCFRQLSDSVQSALVALNHLERDGKADLSNLASPLTEDALHCIADLIKAHLDNKDTQEESITHVVEKMSTRVCRYEQTYGDRIDPQSLQTFVERAMSGTSLIGDNSFTDDLSRFAERLVRWTMLAKTVVPSQRPAIDMEKESQPISTNDMSRLRCHINEMDRIILKTSSPT